MSYNLLPTYEIMGVCGVETERIAVSEQGINLALEELKVNEIHMLEEIEEQSYEQEEKGARAPDVQQADLDNNTAAAENI